MLSCHSVLVALALVWGVHHYLVGQELITPSCYIFLHLIYHNSVVRMAWNTFHFAVSSRLRGQIMPQAFLTWMVMASVKQWQRQPPPLAWGNAGCLCFDLGTLLLFDAMLQSLTLPNVWLCDSNGWLCGDVCTSQLALHRLECKAGGWQISYIVFPLFLPAQEEPQSFSFTFNEYLAHNI